MRTIYKRPEPASLAQHRNSLHANYDNYPDKDILRICLVSEQRGLCCYCLSRIRPDRDHMKIAHWHSQTMHPAEQLNYANLLGACRGNEGQPKRSQHCDTRQGDNDFSRNPSNPVHRVEELIRFTGDGRIESDDREFATELNEILNLNAMFLVNNRKATIDAFIGSLPRQGEARRGALQKWLREWNGEAGAGDLRPFCLVVVYWLRKRLARG